MNNTLKLIRGDSNSHLNPGILDKIIGQKDACKKLSFYVKSHSDTTPFPTVIFTGSQGLGKTYMAAKVAESLGRKLIEVNCGNIDEASKFIGDILISKVTGDKEVTILLDEAHKMSSEITTLLLSILNPNESNTNTFSYGEWDIQYDMSKINLIFATTDAHMIFRPLLNRCKEIYFSLYSNSDLFRILEHYVEGIKITCDKESISYATRGRARDAFMVAQDIKRYCNMNKTSVFDDKAWKELKSVFTIYPYGLNSQEVRFLRVLAKESPISCNAIAIKMGVNSDNIESEIEMRPKELGFVRNESRGRLLTQDGLVYLNNLKKSA